MRSRRHLSPFTTACSTTDILRARKTLLVPHENAALRDAGAGRQTALQQWDRAADRRARAGGGVPADGAADRAEPVGHVRVAVAAAGEGRVEPRAVVGDGEQQPARLLPEPPLDPGARGVLGRVLQRLEAAEVD